MYTGCRIYNGEYILISGFWPERQAKFEKALYDTTGSIMLDFLEEERIDYILYCDKMNQENMGNLLSLALEHPDRFEIYEINNLTKIIYFDWKKNKNGV